MGRVQHAIISRSSLLAAQHCRLIPTPSLHAEWLATQPDTAERVAAARRLAAEGRPEDVAFRATDIDGAAMTARRWLSLAVPGGDDDMFSSSLTAAALQAIFEPLRGLPTLLLLSGAEEYLPPGLDYPAVGRRLAQVRGAHQSAAAVPCVGACKYSAASKLVVATVGSIRRRPCPPLLSCNVCRPSAPALWWRRWRARRTTWVARRRALA